MAKAKAKKKRQKKKWTLKAKLTKVMRQEWSWSPMKREALLRARVGRWVDDKNKCEWCGKIYSRKEISVDHISPVVKPEMGFENWDTYIKRLFCPSEYLAVLCKPCHTDKTKEERILRKKFKDRREAEKSS